MTNQQRALDLLRKRKALHDAIAHARQLAVRNQLLTLKKMGFIVAPPNYILMDGTVNG